MKIALIGYGKMGKAIESIIDTNRHSISQIISKNDIEQNTPILADVVIEFTNPDSAVENIKYCAKQKVPIVVGTTGWYHHFDQVSEFVNVNQSTLFYATNYSIGVNIFFELNKKLAKLMEAYDTYEPILEEIHHTEKKDKPSGTAITLAEGLIESFSRKKSWICRDIENKDLNNPLELQIVSKREALVPGTHSITYDSDIDSISIQHVAKNRLGFAKGSIVAAEFVLDKKGIFTMKDLLNFAI